MPEADPAHPFETCAEGLRLAVKVQPGGRQTALAGLVELGEGKVALKVQLTAPPADGKANAALVALLAKQFGLAKRSVEILHGQSNRQKLVLLRGDSEGLVRRAKSLY